MNFMISTLHHDRELQLKSAIEYSLADLGLIETPQTSASSSPALSVNSLTMNSNWCPLAHTVDDLIYQVQFKFQYRFCANGSTVRRLKIGDFAIIDCGKGQVDLGVVSKVFTPEQFVMCDQMDKDHISKGNIVRTATEQERTYLPIKHAQEIKLFQYCKYLVERMQLDIKVYGIDYQFDGNLVTVYYTSNNLVNLDGLVQELFKSSRTPVLMYRTPRRIRYSAKSFANRSLVTGQNVYVA